MKNTKNKILTTARKLFNEKSYFNVTIRMIANELNMSSGNLNYHFKKRSEILRALYFEMVEIFDKRIEVLPTQTLSMLYIRQSIRSSMVRMLDYQFIWIDLYYILKEDKTIETHFRTTYQKRLAGYDFLFNSLINAALMRPTSYSKEYEFLAIQMITYSNNWINSLSFNQTKEMTSQIDYQTDILFSMLYPFLTQKGKTLFQEETSYLFEL